MQKFARSIAQLEDCGIDVLSFVRSRQELWAPDRSGDYATDCATGRFYACELLEFIRITNRPHMLGHVCAAMAAAGIHGGVEVGFFSEIGCRAAAGSMG